MQTFIEIILENEELNSYVEIDNFIEKWYKNSEDKRELHEVLGFTKDEYVAYSINDYLLENIIYSYKFQKHIIERINDILKIPEMYGSCNESIELQIITLLEIWYFEINIKNIKINKRFVLDLYFSEAKKKLPKLGSLPPSHFIKNKTEFYSFLNEIIPTIIVMIKNLRP